MEEAVGGFPGGDHQFQILLSSVNDQKTMGPRAALIKQLVEQVIEGAATEVQAQVIGGDVLQGVSLVENHDSIFR